MEQERNPNKNAELSMEQNYNQIDGIINNLPAAAKQAEADRGQAAPKKNAPDRGDR